MLTKEYSELVKKLGECNKKENIDGINIFIKDIHDNKRKMFKEFKLH